MIEGSENNPSSSLDALWDEAKIKVGNCVIQWGSAMAVVYKIPKSFKFENYKAVQICLARLSGDEQRIELLIRLMKSMPETRKHVGDELFDETLAALKRLTKLSKPRNAIIHGLPVFSMHSDRETREIVRHGIYLIQTREPETSDERYGKLLTICDEFITEIRSVQRVLTGASLGISREELLKLVNDYNSQD